MNRLAKTRRSCLRRNLVGHHICFDGQPLSPVILAKARIQEQLHCISLPAQGVLGSGLSRHDELESFAEQSQHARHLNR